MEIIKPSYEIMTPLTESRKAEMLQLIEAAGRVCYKSEAKNPDLDPEITNKFIEGIIKKGHTSVIEHEKLTVRFVVDRGVTHEMVRHRLCSFSQESTRYCNYTKKGMQFILPPWVNESWLGVLDTNKLTDFHDKETFDDFKWAASMKEACATYERLLQLDWSPQQARSVLPNSLKTEIVITANLRQWREVFSQRCTKFAHPQMREIMVPLFVELRKELPAIFGDMFPDETAQAN